MTRDEQIIQAAKQEEKKVGFAQIVKKAKGVNSAYGIGFLEGAKWADEHTIEVKEVDLEKEIECEYNPMDGLSFEEFARIAKHFFELGLKTKDIDVENSFNAIVCKIGSTYLKEMDKDAIIKALEPYKDGDKVKIIIKAQKGE